MLSGQRSGWTAPELSSHLGEVPRQNGCRSGTGRHVHLRGLPLGGPMPGLSRCGEAAWCPSPGGDSGSETR